MSEQLLLVLQNEWASKRRSAADTFLLVQPHGRCVLLLIFVLYNRWNLLLLLLLSNATFLAEIVRLPGHFLNR